MTTAEIKQEGIRRRERSILAFFSTSVVSRAIGIGCVMVQIPIALHHLGNEAFGLWVTLFSLGFILAFSDFGVGLGIQNRIADALGKSDLAASKRIFNTGMIFLIAVTLLLIGGCSLVAAFVDFPKLLQVTDPIVSKETGTAVFATAILWCLNIPLGVGQRIAYASQLGWAHNVAQSVSQVLFFGCVVWGASLKLPLTAFCLLTFSSSIIVNALFFIYLLRRLNWLSFSLRHFEFSLLGELGHVGFFFSLQQIATVVLFAAPPIILSAALGAAEVTPFNLTQRVLNLFIVPANAILIPIWPAYTEAKARNDWTWIRRTLWRSLGLVTIVTVIPMIAVGPFVPTLIDWWTQGAAELPNSGLVWLMIAWNALMVLQQPFGYFLSGISEIRIPTLLAILSTIVSLITIYALIPNYGVNAIPIGLITGFVPFIFVGCLWQSVSIIGKLSSAKTVPER